MFRHHLCAAFALAVLIGCSKPSTEGDSGTKSDPSPTNPTSISVPTLTTQGIPGGVVAKVTAQTGGQITAANAVGSSGSFRRAAVTVPPGALSIDADIELSEATSFVSPALADILQVNEVLPGGPALVINASATLTGSLAISVPLDDELMLLPVGKVLTVIGVLGSGQGAQLRVFGQNEIRIMAGTIQVTIDQFGAYQAAVVDRPPQAVSMQTAIEVKKRMVTSTDQGPTTTNMYYINSPVDLPPCDSSRLGNLYYVMSDGLFRNCTSNGWLSVDLRGAKGATGSPAPTLQPTPDLSKSFDSSELSKYSLFIDGRYINRTVIRYSDKKNSSSTWECFADAWTEPQSKLPLNVGIIEITKKSGPQGCIQSTEVSLSCLPGYDLYQGECVARCGPSNLSLCSTELLCNERGLTWLNGSCIGQCSSSNLPACSTKSLCESQGLVWNGASCVRGCSSSTLDQCTTQLQCEAKGFTWSSNNSGQCIGMCSSTNLSACNTQIKCEVKQLSWVGGECLGYCTSSNLAACTTHSKCEAWQLTWADNTCLGYCASNNRAACNTINKCQQAYTSGHSSIQGPHPYQGYFSEEFSSSPGYWMDGSCKSSCPHGTIVTSRGCEIPNLPCASHQKLIDNACQDITFTDIPGNICGTYAAPARITSGTHLVTCDSVFQGPVRIEAGSNIEASGSVSLEFTKYVIAQGTSANKIFFRAKDANSHWTKFAIKTAEVPGSYSPLTLPFSFKSGTDIAHTQISGINPGQSSYAAYQLMGHYNHVIIHGSRVSFGTYDSYNSDTKTTFIENSTISGDGLSIRFDQHGAQDTPLPNLVMFNTAINNTSTGGSSLSVNGGPVLAISNTFSSISCSQPFYDLKALAFFNTFECIYNDLPYRQISSIGSPSYLYGNQIGDSELTSLTTKSDNSPASVSSKVGVLLLHKDWMTPAKVMVTKPNEPIRLRILTFTKDGVIVSHTATWSLTDNANNDAPLDLPAGLIGPNPNFSIASPGSYRVHLTGLTVMEGDPASAVTKEIIGNLYLNITVAP